MDEQLVVAVYNSEERAEAATRDLREAGVPESAIDRHAREGTVSHKDEKEDKPSFWQRLFGSSDKHDTSDYDRHVDEGAVVVAVRSPIAELDNIEAILEKHDPVDLDEQRTGTAAGGLGAATATGAGGLGAATATGATAGRGTAHTDQEETLPLAEEELQVGKRDVNHGTTRVRRHVVDTPVEEDVRLRDESVSVERRPVTGDRNVTDADFTDRTVEMTETDEEAVVGKQTHVREEVAIRKDVGEHTEHVSDHVRHHEVDIDETDATRERDDRLDPKKR